MNKSIYKKQLAFKNSLPQYKDGGNIFQKAGAGALGVLSKVPIIQSFAPMMENAKIVENNQASFNTGQGLGAVGMAVGKGLTGDIGGAVSSGLDAGKEFMEVGSTVAKQKGNTERADRLDKAAMGFQAGSQAAGMASMMGGNFKSGEGISKMLGFGTMFGNTGGNIPIEMKNGGSIPKYPNGGYNYSTEGVNQGSNYNVKNPSNTSQFVEPKKKVLSEVEKKLMQQQVMQEDGTVTDGLGNVIKQPYEKATGAIEESVSPIDLIGSGIYSGGAKMLAKGLNKAGSKILPKNFKSEIDWAKWNPDTPKYPELINEYNAIEESTKKAGTWMKNPDGSAFQGTPEQFIQQQSSWFKKAFPEGFDKGYRGAHQHIDDFSKRERNDYATFLTDNLENAKSYAPESNSQFFSSFDKNYEWKDGLYELAIPKNSKRILGTADNKSWRLLNWDTKVASGTQKKDFAKSHNDYLKDIFNKGEVDSYAIQGYNPNKKYLSTDIYANYVKNKNNPEAIAEIKKVIDTMGNRHRKPTTVYAIDSDRVNLKSLIGNVGFFDMTNPNIYKSIVPTAIGAGALQEKKNGGPMGKSNKKELIEYNGATHENSPIDGIPIAENGQQLHSGFKSQVPTNTQALVAHGETYDPNQRYIYSNELKPMKSKVTFAEMSKRIDSKYKDRNDDIAKATKAKELENLANQNEEMRLAKEAKKNPFKMKNGGKLPKYNDGAPFVEGYKRDGLDYLNNINLDVITPTSISTGQAPLSLAGQLEKNTTMQKVAEPSISNNFFKSTPTTSNTNNLARTQATQRRLSNPLNTAPNTTTPNQQLTLGDKMQLGAEGAAGLALLGMGMKKPEVYKPLTSPLFGSGLNDMNQTVRFNTNPILMNRNVGANQINQGSTSDAIRRANLHGLFRGTNTQLGEMAEREALANAQIRQQLGQTKIGVGQQDVAAQEKARLMSAEARAAAQNLRAQGLQTLFGAASNVGKGMNVRQGNTIKMNVLNSLAGQYGVDPKTLEIIFKEQGITTIK